MNVSKNLLGTDKSVECFNTHANKLCTTFENLAELRPVIEENLRFYYGEELEANEDY